MISKFIIAVDILINMPKLTIKSIKSKLKEVLDPELGISIVDMGLIYKVTFIKNKVQILMTLTTIGCPLISTIEEEIKAKIGQLKIPRKDIIINLTFDPPWTMDKMSKSAKARLGM